MDKRIKTIRLYGLCTKPSPGSCSLGQLITHLINDTNFYIEQIKICVTTNENINEGPSPSAQTMFRNNNFPDTIIEGNPDNANIPQPDSKEELINSLLNLKEEMNSTSMLISKSRFNGKTKHPGLGYFNADEWLQFAEMHFRHHVRQKKRIGEFLRK